MRTAGGGGNHAGKEEMGSGVKTDSTHPPEALFTRDAGNPIEVIYPAEGSPLVPAMVAVMEEAPHPNAARLFATYLYSLEAQQLISDDFALRSFHPGVKPKPGRKPLSDIKLVRLDPHELRASAEEIKSRYSKIFGV